MKMLPDRRSLLVELYDVRDTQTKNRHHGHWLKRILHKRFGEFDYVSVGVSLKRLEPALNTFKHGVEHHTVKTSRFAWLTTVKVDQPPQ